MKWTYENKVVPNPLELPRVVKCLLVLHHAREESDEERRCEVGRVYGFILKVIVQVWQVNGNQSIGLVEHQLQHRQLRVEQLCHLVLVYYLLQDAESQVFLAVHGQIKITCHEVIALTVVKLFVRDCVCFQDV